MDDRKLKARAAVKVQKELNMCVSSYCVFYLYLFTISISVFHCVLDCFVNQLSFSYTQ